VFNQDAKKRPSPSELADHRLIAKYARNASSDEKIEINSLKKRIKEVEEESKSNKKKIEELKAELKSKDLKYLGLISLLFPYSFFYYIFTL
jgi:chromosome segregation ATPase